MTLTESGKLQMIRSYATIGLRVVPIPPGTKHPGLPAWQDAATTDDGLIVDWWSHWPDYGVGIVCGRLSGVFVLDVDISEGKRGDDTLADLEATYGPLPDTWTVVTGTGGSHYYFRMPEGVTITNDAGRRLGPGLDIRGEGGQVLAPGSIHPNGKPYLWDLLLNPGTVPLADPPAWLVDRLTNPATAGEPRRGKAERPGGEALPGDVFAAEHSWAELLEAAGATYMGTMRHRDGGSYEQWARPGVDHPSATLYYGGSDVLKVFTSSWPGLTEGATYTRYGFWVALNHGGDFKAATVALGHEQRATMMDAWAEEATKGESKHSNNNGGTKGESELSDNNDAPEPWGQPLPLGGHYLVPGFPAEVLPGWMGAYVRALAVALQVPLDLPASMGLAALAVAAGGRCILMVNGGWTEPLNIYACCAMASGSRKSAVFQAITKPLFEIERAMKETVDREIAEAQAARKAAARARDMAETEWAKSPESGKEKAFEALKAAAVMAESVTVPSRPRLLADDATPEALGTLLAEQGGRIAIMSAEGDVFDLMAGRYSGNPNLGVYLKAHAGDPYVLDRQGRPAQYVPAPALTIGLAVQPDVLQSIASRPGFRGRGLLARFLYSIPANLVGTRDALAPEVPGMIRDRYETKLKELVAALAEWCHPNMAVLTLEPEARAALTAFQVALEPRLHPGTGDLGGIADWASKLVGAVLRIAGLLHLAEHGAEGYRRPVELATFEAAKAIGDYFTGHALAVFRFMEESYTAVHALRMLDLIVATGWESFTQRQMFVRLQGTFKTVDAMQPAFVYLMDREWIREIAVTKQGPGRPSRLFQVTPNIDKCNIDKMTGPRVESED